MRGFKGQIIDTPGVMQLISRLFYGNLTLIKGFNTFLTVGYRIDVSPNTILLLRRERRQKAPTILELPEYSQPATFRGLALTSHPLPYPPPRLVLPPLGSHSTSVRRRYRDPLLNAPPKRMLRRKLVKPADEDEGDKVGLHLFR
ncbi:hypothetical protein DFS33DRAFT_144867 [Desarmillaria ectypa]|nr:hypothetical protein DFS33DRAFT_144867 [Desarmillaria ectypa]